MTKSPREWVLALGAALVLSFAATAPVLAAPANCTGAGVVTRITGEPTNVVITRGTTRVRLPRVLEVICVGDRVAVTGNTQVTLSVDGRGSVQVDARTPYTVAARSGAPSLAGNAYRAVNDQVMPDMKRMPWNVRLKAEDPFAFNLTALANGTQELSPGQRALLVRVSGGQGPYQGTLSGPAGQVGQASAGPDGKLQFPSANLSPGAYRVQARDASGATVEATFTVVARSGALPTTYSAIEDPEVRAAATAAALAREEPKLILEAQQVLAAAPSNGLDRDRVYDLIESYGAE